MAGTFIYNRAFDAEVVNSPAMAAFLLARAEAGAAYARSIAPVESGAFRDSIGAEVAHDGTGLTGRITAGTDHWAYLEFGTSDTPTFGTLRKALDAVT